ncbi:MAG TPA: succinate dehydrogenase cytochrome b subunit [Bryobacteraceae bacterium]|jgi:succinate dehydrogenase / fumarate reductase cytochrome b subunit|nr:succinate dehydrogenase cytochrome b subunit [Bryobacteraceae bacterium]
MSTTVIGVAQRANLRFFETTVGKKAVMAVSGIILFGFVAGHLAGNLQVYEGPQKLDAYARFLRSMPALLWGARITLLVMVALHIWSAVKLAVLKRKARPVQYVKRRNVQASYAARTMYWSGPIILCFVIYHLMQFTFGVGGTPYEQGHVYANLVRGFQVIPVSAFYILSMLLLGLHLDHGLWSLFQSLGFSHPRYTPVIKRLATAISVLIVAGNISIPISVLAGWVR